MNVTLGFLLVALGLVLGHSAYKNRSPIDAIRSGLQPDPGAVRPLTAGTLTQGVKGG